MPNGRPRVLSPDGSPDMGNLGRFKGFSLPALSEKQHRLCRAQTYGDLDIQEILVRRARDFRTRTSGRRKRQIETLAFQEPFCLNKFAATGQDEHQHVPGHAGQFQCQTLTGGQAAANAKGRCDISWRTGGLETLSPMWTPDASRVSTGWFATALALPGFPAGRLWTAGSDDYLARAIIQGGAIWPIERKACSSRCRPRYSSGREMAAPQRPRCIKSGPTAQRRASAVDYRQHSEGQIGPPIRVHAIFRRAAPQ